MNIKFDDGEVQQLEEPKADTCFDGLDSILKDLKKYRSYESVSCQTEDGKNKKYLDIMDKTASGLLRDVAVTTNNLSSAEKKKHEIAVDTFAAFCMFHCIRYMKAKKDNEYFHPVIQNCSMDIIDKTCKYMYDCLKQDFKKNSGFPHIRAWITTYTKSRMMDYAAKEARLSHEPLEYETEEGDEIINSEILDWIIEDASASANREIIRSELLTVLETMHYQNLISREEIDIICYRYPLGDGYEELSNGALAKKLGHSDSYVSKHLAQALQKMKDFIMKNPEHKDVLCP